jgi:hypothetical protein
MVVSDREITRDWRKSNGDGEVRNWMRWRWECGDSNDALVATGTLYQARTSACGQQP